MSKKNKKKSVEYVTYNKKEFLVPNSIYSMAAISTKIHSDGMAIIRISDCNRTIKLWNDLNDKEQVKELVDKTNTMINSLNDFRNEIMGRYGLEHFFSFREQKLKSTK